MKSTFLQFCFLIQFLPVTISQCPKSNSTLHRIEDTRYFIIQNTQKRGEFVTIEQARKDCNSHGLKLATIKDMLALAVVGRPLERMVFKEKLKDTWYWLDAKYDNKSERYHWGDNAKDVLNYTLILYRNPRPIGVSSHMTYYNYYQKEADIPQCLTLALPWLGSADHNENTTYFFGHQTSFDERDCQSKKKRHAICEGNKKDCDTTESDPFDLDESKHDYFETGNWIFGNRTYMVNWKQRTFNESEKYCKSLGLQLMNSGPLEKFLIPHIKMWTREITAAQFWTAMSYHEETKEYMDSSGNSLPNTGAEINFAESPTQMGRSLKNSPIFCVAISHAYEFLSQMPCSNPLSRACMWSFLKYTPANCNNYHGTICEHAGHTNRPIKWDADFKEKLDKVLENTAVTAEFGYKNNTLILRSKYKQTFGLCYCPEGYRMIRSQNNNNIAWSIKPANSAGKEIYEYDYIETYWMVDKDLYKKDIDSTCTISQYENGNRKFKDVKCTDWHFYLCEKIGRRPKKPLEVIVNKAPPSIWDDGPQPRTYPLTREDPERCGAFHNNTCKCVERSDRCGYNTVTQECLPRLKECPKEAFHKKFCQRKGDHVYYAVQGLVCNSQYNNSLCNIEKQVYAVNMGGKAHVDSRNINYTNGKEAEKDWEVPSGFWLSGGNRYTTIPGIPSLDEDLYKDFASGRSIWFSRRSKDPKDYCAKRFFEIMEDGLYEISIKVGELWYKENEAGDRLYSFLLNDLYIVREFYHEKFRRRPQGIEFVANFKIFKGRTMLTLQGHPSKKIPRTNNTLKFQACYSLCHKELANKIRVDRNWVMYAVSIIKLTG